MGPLLWLIGAIVIAAVVLWGLGELPLDDTLRKIARVIIIVVVVIYAVYVVLAMLGATMPPPR